MSSQFISSFLLNSANCYCFPSFREQSVQRPHGKLLFVPCISCCLWAPCVYCSDRCVLRWALWRLARWQNILQWQLKDPEGFDVHWVFIVYTWLAHTGARPAMLLRATLRNDATCLVDVTRRTFHKYNLILFDWCHWSKLCFLVFWDWSSMRVCIYYIYMIYASSICTYNYVHMYIYV
jgi:hypothetical protein